MNLLEDKIQKIYFNYFLAAFGSAMISSIYGLVDMAVVGQYHGPNGSAALAVVAPVWNIIYSLGLFMGVGGSIIFSMIKGKDKTQEKAANAYFTVALIGSIILSIIAWGALILFEEPLLIFFGASNDTLLALAKEYLIPIKFIFPAFLFNQMLAAFLRNDNDPKLATIAVLAGGIFNVFGDLFFVFALKMGIFGAGLATAIGSIITLIVLLIHFFRKCNTLHFVKPCNFFTKFGEVSKNGFSSFFVDAAMGVLTIIFNKQIMKYLGSDALAVYGPIINISTFVQCCSYSVGQASQPIISMNYGAKKYKRIKGVLKYAIYTATFFALFWTSLSLLFPNMYIRIFMQPTPQILEIAPAIIRTYALSFLLLPLNIFSTYYFQSINKPRVAFLISVMRGMILSGALIMLLPLIKPSLIWLSMPITEVVVAIYVIYRMVYYTKKFDNLSL